MIQNDEAIEEQFPTSVLILNLFVFISFFLMGHFFYR